MFLFCCNKSLDYDDEAEDGEEYVNEFSARYWMNFLLWLFYLPEFVCFVSFCYLLFLAPKDFLWMAQLETIVGFFSLFVGCY